MKNRHRTRLGKRVQTYSIGDLLNPVTKATVVENGIEYKFEIISHPKVISEDEYGESQTCQAAFRVTIKKLGSELTKVIKREALATWRQQLVYNHKTKERNWAFSFYAGWPEGAIPDFGEIDWKLLEELSKLEFEGEIESLVEAY